ncbi:uncharacterized protein METZ01_LOCUS468294, partial [marine metagenome]
MALVHRRLPGWVGTDGGNSDLPGLAITIAAGNHVRHLRLRNWHLPKCDGNR